MIVNPSWFRRPGTASTFTPRDGTDQAWITSVAVTNMRVSRLRGKIKRLSTSSSRYSPTFKS